MDFHIHKPQDAAGGGESTVTHRQRSRRTSQNAPCPQRHELSLQCHQREHEAGTACPRTGWLSAAGHRLYCPQSCRLNCRLALPAVHKRCPDGKPEFSRALPLFPPQLQEDGQENHRALLKRSHRAAFQPEKGCCFTTCLNCMLGGRKLTAIFTPKLCWSQEVKPITLTARRLQHPQAVYLTGTS